MESGDHARENVERKGQPRPTNGFACFLVDDESVDLCMIDLDNLEGARRAVVVGRWRCRFDDLCFAAPSPSSLEVNVFDAGFDCAPVRRLKSRFFAAHQDLSAQFRKWRPGGLQIVARYRLSDDFFSLLVECTKAFAPARVRSMSEVTVPPARNSRIIP